MKTYRNEPGYYELLSDILRFGSPVPDRTGIGSIALFDAKLVIDQEKPFLSTRRPAPLRMAFEEFWMFLRGETQTKQLEEKNIYFWSGNTSRAFLDNRGLTHLNEGDMGAAYGHQFRHFGAPIQAYGTKGIDQLAQSLHLLKTDPYSRRNLVTFWNPSQSHEMALTPCWHTHQLVVLPEANGTNTLHMKLINRSLDTLFGLLFAVQQYRLYQTALCQMYNFNLGYLSCDLSQVHIYHNQIDYAEECLTRFQPSNTGKVTITKPLETLDDLISLQWSDILVENLIVNSAPFITPKPPMAV